MSNEQRRSLIEEASLAVRMHQNAMEEVDEAAAEYLGINRTDARCLDIIDQHGHLTAGELARESGLTTGAVTALLDRLEERGYVRRVRDKSDRRLVIVEMTEKARRRAWEVFGPIAEEGFTELDRFTDEELTFIRDFMSVGREILIGHASRIRAMARRRAEATRARRGRERRPRIANRA